MTFEISNKLDAMARTWPRGRERFYSRFAGAAQALMTDEQALVAIEIIETFREQDARLTQECTHEGRTQ
jgi:hypothetical protein